MKVYSYQYETSPRKLKTDYSESRKKSSKVQNRRLSKSATSKSKERVKKENARRKDKSRAEKDNSSKKTNISDARINFAIAFKCVLIFSIFFLIIYRNSLITQSSARIQTLRASITELQKETDQLEINIQNSLNTNNIEQAAKELLGMQKLTNKQIVYISLSKKDYIEPRTEEVIIEKEPNFIENIINRVKGLF